MNPIGLLLASRSLDLALRHEPSSRPADAPLGPIASTPETAAAWRRWRAADDAPVAATVAHIPDRPMAARVSRGHPG